MSEPAPPSKQSLIFLFIAIGFCCCLSLILGVLYLFYRKQKADTVSDMAGTWLNRDTKELAMNIEDDKDKYVTVKRSGEIDITLEVSNRNPFKATYSKEDPADPIPDQEPVRTHIKTVYTLTSTDGKSAEFNTTSYDKYGPDQRATEDSSNVTIKLIKQGETEEEFSHINYCPHIQRCQREQRRRRRRCNCLNHKFSPYPNMW